MRLPVRCSLRFPVDGDYRRRSFFGSTTHRVKSPANAAPAMIASIGFLLESISTSYSMDWCYGLFSVLLNLC